MRTTSKFILGLLFIAFVFIILTCTQKKNDEIIESSVVNLRLDDFAFGIVDSINSGWVTFRMENHGQENHEFFMHRLPDDISFEKMYNQIVLPLDSLQRLLIEGEIDSSQYQNAVAQTYPKWISNLKPYGGGGHISPDRISETSLKLHPGNYVMTCFINSPNGRGHLFQGMVKPITVTEDSSTSKNPEPDVELTSTGSNITMDGTFGSGEQTMALHVQDPSEQDSISYPSAMLFRLDENTDKEDLQNYMTNPHQFEVLGGTIGVPTGQKSYVSSELTPGDYVWAFPNEQAETKFEEFTVK